MIKPYNVFRLASIFDQSPKAQNFKCLNLELDHALGDVRDPGGDVHSYLRVSACALQKETRCLVTIDDGFFEVGFSHPDRWPTRPDYADMDGLSDWFDPDFETGGIIVPHY